MTALNLALPMELPVAANEFTSILSLDCETVAIGAV